MKEERRSESNSNNQDSFNNIDVKYVELISRNDSIKRQCFGAFLNYLCVKLGIPEERMTECLQSFEGTGSGVASTINGYSLPLNVLTIAKGWKDVQPKLVLPVMYAGLSTMLIGLMNGLADIMKWERFQTGRDDYKAINAGIAASMYVLRTIIAVYVFAATDFGKENKEVDSSLGVFLAMAGAGVALGAITAAYNVVDNHSQIKKTYARVMQSIFNALTHASTIHSLITGLDALGDKDVKTNTDPTAEFITYFVSLPLGAAIATWGHYRPKQAAKMISYVSAFTILSTLMEIYKNTANNENTSDASRNALLALWIVAMLIPAMTGICRIGYDCYKKARYYDYESIEDGLGKSSISEVPEEPKMGYQTTSKIGNKDDWENASITEVSETKDGREESESESESDHEDKKSLSESSCLENVSFFAQPKNNTQENNTQKQDASPELQIMSR